MRRFHWVMNVLRWYLKTLKKSRFDGSRRAFHLRSRERYTVIKAYFSFFFNEQQASDSCTEYRATCMSRIIEVCNFFETKGCFVFKQCTCYQGALSYAMSHVVSVVSFSLTSMSSFLTFSFNNSNLSLKFSNVTYL